MSSPNLSSKCFSLTIALLHNILDIRNVVVNISYPIDFKTQELIFEFC